MFPAPVIVRSENHYPGDETNDVIGQLRFEEGSMAAVMHNDEHPHGNRSGQNG